MSEKKYTFKKKKFAWEPENEFIVDLMNSKLGVMTINWAFQGILGADRTEQIFKLAFDLIFTLIFTVILAQFQNIVIAFPFAMILAHTVNWLFNGQFWVAGRFCGITKNSRQKILDYLKAVDRRVSGAGSLLGAAIFGSPARGLELRSNSDIDLRLVRRRGVMNGIIANLIGLSEKARAFVSGIPLHLFVYDSMDSLNRLRVDEKPYILYDPDDLLKAKYRHKGYRLFPEEF